MPARLRHDQVNQQEFEVLLITFGKWQRLSPSIDRYDGSSTTNMVFALRQSECSPVMGVSCLFAYGEG